MYDKAAKVFLFRSQWFPTNPCGLLFLARSSYCFLFKDASFLRLHFVCPLLTNCELALPFCFLAAWSHAALSTSPASAGRRPGLCTRMAGLCSWCLLVFGWSVSMDFVLVACCLLICWSSEEGVRACAWSRGAYAITAGACAIVRRAYRSVCFAVGCVLACAPPCYSRLLYHGAG